VGASTAATLLGQRILAPLLDRYLARTGYESQQKDEPAALNRPHNLWRPLDGEGGVDYGAHGDFDDRSHAHAPQAWAIRHARSLGLAAACAAVGAGVGGAKAARSQR
jgi:hypothetical protein